VYCYYSDDILRCYESAEKGFKIWSMKPIQTRIQILSKFLPILKLKGYKVTEKILICFLYNILFMFAHS